MICAVKGAAVVVDSFDPRGVAGLLGGYLAPPLGAKHRCKSPDGCEKRLRRMSSEASVAD